jgi:hypothetical protein
MPAQLPYDGGQPYAGNISIMPRGRIGLGWNRPAITVRPRGQVGLKKRQQQWPGRTLTTRINQRTGRAEAVAGVDNDTQRQAELIAAGLLDPQMAAINRAVAASQQQELARAEAFKGVSAALAQYTQGIPEAIRSAYAGAADRTAAYAGGMTGALSEQAAAAAKEAGQTIATMGAPGAGEVKSEAPALANVGYYLGGQLPASNLAAEAASRLAEASIMRGAGGGKLAEEALQSMNATRKETDELRARGLDLEMTRPAEVQKALAQLRSESREERQMRLQERAERVQEGQLQLATAKTAYDRAEALTNLTGYVHEVRHGKVVRTKRPAPGSEAWQAQAGLESEATKAAREAAEEEAKARRPNAELSRLRGYLVDSYGQPILKNGKRQPVAKGGRGGGAGGENLTPNQKSLVMNRGNTAAKGAIDQMKKKIWENIPASWSDQKANIEYRRRLKMNRGSIVTAVWRALAPHLRQLGWQDSRIRDRARALVDQALPR